MLDGCTQKTWTPSAAPRELRVFCPYEHACDRRQCLQLLRPRSVRLDQSDRFDQPSRLTPAGADGARRSLAIRAMTRSMIRNANSSERSDDGAQDSASICEMNGSAFGDGERLGAEKRNRLVEVAAAATSLNSSSQTFKEMQRSPIPCAWPHSKHQLLFPRSNAPG